MRVLVTRANESTTTCLDRKVTQEVVQTSKISILRICSANSSVMEASKSFLRRLSELKWAVEEEEEAAAQILLSRCLPKWPVLVVAEEAVAWDPAAEYNSCHLVQEVCSSAKVAAARALVDSNSSKPDLSKEERRRGTASENLKEKKQRQKRLMKLPKLTPLEPKILQHSSMAFVKVMHKDKGLIKWSKTRKQLVRKYALVAVQDAAFSSSSRPTSFHSSYAHSSDYLEFPFERKSVSLTRKPYPK